MKRRELLQRAALAPAAAGLLRGQQPVVPPKPTPAAEAEIPVIDSTIPDMAGLTVQKFFSPGQYTALERLADLIAPEANGVPGALAAGAPAFLDFLIGESPEARQRLYRNGLDRLNEDAQKRYGRDFAHLNATEAGEVMKPLSQPWQAQPADTFPAFLYAAKEDVLRATQNSREWIRAMSKRVRRAGGVGMYWHPID